MVNPKTNSIVVNWDQIYSQARRLASDIIAFYKRRGLEYIYMYGIPRGGLPVVTLLSHLVEYYGIRTDVVTDLTMLDVAGNKDYYTDKDTLIIVDEICDGGNTLKLWTQRFPNAMTAVLHRRMDSEFKPDFWAYEIKGDEWIQYPWECK
jgi:hypoxanthine phosphoribosyltransferase